MPSPVTLPPPQYPGIMLIVLATAWLDTLDDPKQRKRFLREIDRAIARHDRGEELFRFERPAEETEEVEAEVEKAFAMLKAWRSKLDDRPKA